MTRVPIHFVPIRGRMNRPQGAAGEEREADAIATVRFRAMMRRHGDVVALFLVSLVLYAATAAPSVATVFDDSLEFHVVVPTLSIAHPSGYPLYTLLGKLATLLIPGRDPAGRLNLFSALTAALAVGVLAATAKRLAGSRPAAIVATIAFAISPAWWSQATLAEVYALHGLLMMLFIWLMVQWEERCSSGVRGQASDVGRQTSNARRQASEGWLAAAGLVFGLGLAHHRMIALLLPAALIFIVWTDPRLLRQPRRWPAPIVAGLAPLLLYLYLPLRGQVASSLDGTFDPGWRGVLNWITARAYGVFLSGNPFGVQRDAGFFVRLFLDQIGVLPVLAAVIGLATAWRSSLRRYVFLALATILTIAFGAVYKVQDIAVFFIPAFMLVALWAALGLGPTFDTALAYATGLGRSLNLPHVTRPIVLGGATLLMALVILIEPLSAAGREWTKRDLSRAWEVYDYGQEMLAAVAPAGRVVGLLGETTLLRYFRDVLGRRPDVIVIPADREADRFAAVDAALATAAPVYLTRELPGAAARYSLDAAGPLIAVSMKAQPTAPPQGQPVAPGIVLVDVKAEIRRRHAGPIVRVSPTWSAATPIADELKVSARLLDATGAQLAQSDRVPVHFAYPTPAWVVGETVRDNYDLPLPATTPAGPLRVLLIIYRATDGGEIGRVEVPLS